MTALIAISVCALFLSGCGITKWSDTARTGTEQLLISNAIDTAVSKINFRPMGDKKTFIDTTAIDGAIDYRYLAKAIRQHLAASGGIICDDKEDADYILEVRTGAVGTDRSELLLVGIPALTIPTIPGSQVPGTTIPEIPIIKRTRAIGVAKIAVFAYNQHTGRPLWASGNNQSESTTNHLWVAGAGPLTRGTIHDQTTFAGHTLPEFMTSEKDKKLISFADKTNYYKEIAGEPNLKDKKALNSISETVSPVEMATQVPALTPPVPVLVPAIPQPQIADPWKAQPLPSAPPFVGGTSLPAK